MVPLPSGERRSAIAAIYVPTLAQQV